MSHRAQQILDAVVTVLTSAIPSANVYKHRVLSLSDPDQELPAISVRMGADAAVSPFGTDNTAFIDSVLEIAIDAVQEAATEEDLLKALTDLRRSIHVALAADFSVGLAFVITGMYAGAQAPQMISTGERLAGELSSSWRFLYRMNISDPS